MSCLQVIVCCSAANASRSSAQAPNLRSGCPFSVLPSRKKCPKLLVNGTRRYGGVSPTCLSGGKGKGQPNDDTDASPWKSLEKAMGNFGKERSIQDVLREQMKEQELTGGGGSRNPPGGGDGGGDSSGDSEDAGFSRIIDEIVQVVLATLGFIFVYIYMIRGEELFRLVKDYIKYLFGSKASVRLRRAMYVWGRFYKRITTRKVVDRYWLERAILTTPTWLENPRLLAHRMSPDED